jgi:DNA replication protein DnaC
MSEKIDKTLKKIASAASESNKAEQPKVDETALPSRDLLGEPDCPICHGLGYYRLEVPLNHPEFGKLQVCSCRNKQISQQVRQRLFQLSHLNELSHLTFENFNPRGRLGLRGREAVSLQTAFNQAEQFSRNLNGWLLIRGNYGSGKTHLAAAIANFAVSMGVPTLFITVPDLLDSLRSAYSDPEATFEERLDEIREAPLLVLDDFGTQNATPWAQEKLFQILNYRYINRMPLVVTTNLSLEEIEPRIASRLEDPELVTQVNIYAPDYRQPVEDMHRDELSSLSNMHQLTFASFDLREKEGLSAGVLKTLKDAFKLARDYAEDPQGWLVLMGKNGVGKTHLAAAIGNYCLEMDHAVTMVGVIDLLDHLRGAFSPTSMVSMDRRFDQIKNVELLILDDYGSHSSTPWAREKLNQLINHRYVKEMPTIITTALKLDDLDPRLRSRINDARLCQVVEIAVPEYRPKPVVRRRSRIGRRN